MSTKAIPSRAGVKVGDVAPDFELKDGDGQTWRLSDHRGRVVALVFYPRDETSVCTKQLCSMRDRWSDYQATGAEVVAISVDSIESHRKFAEHHGFPQRLLADDAQTVTRLYKVKSVLGGSQRAVIVIDGDGVVRFRKSVFPLFRPTDDEVLTAIRSTAAIPVE